MPILGFTYVPLLHSMVANTNTVNAGKGADISYIDTIIGTCLNFISCERKKT